MTIPTYSPSTLGDDNCVPTPGNPCIPVPEVPPPDDESSPITPGNSPSLIRGLNDDAGGSISKTCCLTVFNASSEESFHPCTVPNSPEWFDPTCPRMDLYPRYRTGNEYPTPLGNGQESPSIGNGVYPSLHSCVVGGSTTRDQACGSLKLYSTDSGGHPPWALQPPMFVCTGGHADRYFSSNEYFIGNYYDSCREFDNQGIQPPICNPDRYLTTVLGSGHRCLSVLNMEINPKEVNSYPVNVGGTTPQTEITITVKNRDGGPSSGKEIEISSCTLKGSPNTDGHFRDTGSNPGCFKLDNPSRSSRPPATFTWNNQASKGKITVTTDNNGLAKVVYFPPSVKQANQDYFISGKDIISATLIDSESERNHRLKEFLQLNLIPADELHPGPDGFDKFIILKKSLELTTKVPDLKPIPGYCKGTSDYKFASSYSGQNCLVFFGTADTNEAIVKMAADFRERVVDCTDSDDPKTDPSCDVTSAGAVKGDNDFVTLHRSGILPTIAMMSLPWGGMIEQGDTQDWIPFRTDHNDGREVDLSVKTDFLTVDEKRLLRDVLLDNGFILPVSGEGMEDNVDLVTDHFHAEYTNPCSDTAEPLSSPFFLAAYAQAVCGPTELVVTTNDDIVNDKGCTAGIKSDDCSLREAVLEANKNPNKNIISFSLDSSKLIIQLESTISIKNPVTIDGNSELDPTGNPLIQLTTSSPTSFNGIEIMFTGQGSTIRGLIIYGFTGSGIDIINSRNNRVEGNYIGINPGFSIVGGNFIDGIRIENSLENEIKNNVIGNNAQNGISIMGEFSLLNTIYGNLIGLTQTGLARPNLHSGIYIDSSHENQIGGKTPDRKNIIAHNKENGVTIVGDKAIHNSIIRNSIYDNIKLGIDLGADGPSANDNNDADIGPNGRMNFPVAITSEYDIKTGKTLISGVLQTTAPEKKIVDIYSIKEPDLPTKAGAPSGFGEGQTYIATATPDAKGYFFTQYDGKLPFNFLSGLVTDEAHSTSEFGLVCGDTDNAGAQAHDGNPDNDGDGICDDWEAKGIDFDGDQSSDFTLSRVPLAPNVDHKDIYVEVDYMQNHAPFVKVETDIERTFANIPNFLIGNPNGGPGIHFDIQVDSERGGLGIPSSPFTDFLGSPLTVGSFQELKGNWFGTSVERGSPNTISAKKLIYRYTIFANDQPGRDFGSSGKADLPGDDFEITLGTFPRVVSGGITTFGTVDHQEGAFMHELGHTLNLHHGGNDDINCKPNYLSIMSYSLTMPDELQFLTAGAGGTGGVGYIRPLDYSQSSLGILNEQSLNEQNGLQDIGGNSNPRHQWTLVGFSKFPLLSSFFRENDAVPINYGGLMDWNRDGQYLTNVEADLNYIEGNPGCPSGSEEILVGHNDWKSLIYNFRFSEDYRLGAIPQEPIPTELTANDLNDTLLHSRLHMPAAVDQNVTTSKDTFLNINLSATDPDKHGNLIFSIAQLPENGTLDEIASVNGTTATVLYSPNPSFSGSDSFIFYADSGRLDSKGVPIGAIPGIVKISIKQNSSLPLGNRPPVAFNRAIKAVINSSINIELKSYDVDKNVSFLSIEEIPHSGTLTDLNIVQSFGSTLNVTQEIPPVNTNAKGQATFAYNQTSKILRYSMFYNGFTSSETSAHIHSGASGQTGPIQFSLPIGRSKQGIVGPLSQQQESDLLAGKMYVDIHSSSFPNGEIRGQIFSTGESFAIITYSPNLNFTGLDFFRYKANDGRLDSNIATVSINIINSTLNAVSDFATTDQGQPVTVDEMANDFAECSKELVRISKMPEHGTAEFELDRTAPPITYTPYENFSGVDHFSYILQDGCNPIDIGGPSDEGTVTIQVNHVNHLPVGFEDEFDTLQGKPISIDVLANDTDEDLGDQLSVTNIVNNPSHGIAKINTNSNNILYTPNSDFIGTDNFTYEISDHINFSATTVTIRVLNINDPPLAKADRVTVPEDTPIGLDVLANDTDQDGDHLAITSFTVPAHGSLQLNNTAFLYTPDDHFFGSDFFNYTISDGNGKTSDSTVYLNITNVNENPLARSHGYTIWEDSLLTLKLAATDDDDDRLNYTIQKQPAHGDITSFNSTNGYLTYTPSSGYHGKDSLRFKANDGIVDSNNATIFITILKLDDPPIAQPDKVIIQPNTPVDINVLANDSDNDNDPIFIENVTTPGNGIASVLNNKIRYVPNMDFIGNDSFNYYVSDGNYTTHANVTILVKTTNANNTSPIARNDFSNTNEDKVILIPVLQNDTDAEGDNLIIDLIKLQPTNGSSIINPNGTVTYSPITNFFGADKFNYTISDGRGGNATALVSVNVNPVNDAPVAVNDSATTSQNKAIVINVLANDTDVEKDLLAVSAINSQPRHGAATINNNGTVTYSPQTSFSGIDSFIYQVSDGNGGNSTAAVAVNVNSVNKPPVVTILKPTNGSQFTEGDSVAFSGSATDPEDGNISSVMTWESSIDGPLGTGPNIVASALSPGTHSIRASAIDSGQLSNSSTISIIVHHFSQPPVAVGDHFKTNEDTPFNMNVIANDTDPENDALTIAAISQNPNNGQASINNNGTINYSPNQNFNGQDSLVYTVANGLGGNSSAQVLIDVLTVNDNPIARNDSTATNKNTAVLIDVLANDTDVDNDPLTISQVTTPAHGSASIENAKIKYTPNLNFVGIEKFDYTISDANRGSAKASITVNVKSVNQLPVATDGSASTNENTPLKMKLNASDPDNDPLTYIIDTQPSHGSISAFHGNNGTLTYTPQSNFTGQDSLKFKVNDGTSDSNVATVLISVKNVNHSPIAEDQNVVTNINKQIEITLKGHDPDASDKITFIKVTDPSHGVIAGFDTSTGKLTYIPNNAFSGKDNFLFKVIDNNKADSNIATVSITVNAVVNKPPVASNVNVETSQDTAKVITLVGTDPDAGDKIAYHIVSAASSGSLSSIDQTTGKITYTPNKGFLGLDSFTYKVTDLSGANSNIAIVGITVKSTSSTPYPLPPSCSQNDKSGGKALRGTNSDDVIVGTEAGDSIQGLNGNDAINGCGASDNLNGNAGNDGIAGGTNEDSIHGNNGNDYLRGDAGNDALYGGEDDDVLVGGPGRDSFYCGSGNDKVLDFNAKEGDALQKQSNTRGRDATQKSDCENVLSISSTSTSAKSSSQALPPTTTEQISSRDDGNQSQTAITSQLQPSESSTQKGQNETIQKSSNSPPIVNDYTVSIDKNQRVSIILPGNDNDGDKLTFKIINKPQNALVGNFKASGGTLTYTPSKDYVGDDKFRFTATDGKEDSNIGTVTIHVKDKQIIVKQQQTESRSPENQVKPFPLIYWSGNIEKPEKLLPLTVGNLTVDSTDQVTMVLKISSNNHNIYDNTAAQILTAKLNIKNEVNSCKKVNDVIKYGDEMLHSANYQGAGTAMQELSDPQMKSMIKAYSILTQFNMQGCAATSPTGFFFTPGIFEISYTDPSGYFVN